MGFFKFKKRTLNKQAKNPPANIFDFYSTSSAYIGTDGKSFSALDKIASEFAGLNYGIYDVKTRQKVKKNSLYAVLRQPNLDDRHFNFFYQSAIDYFNGGCFWYVVRINEEPVSLFRLNPAEVKLSRDSVTNRRLFLYRGNIYTSETVVYIPSRFDYSTRNGGSSIFSAVKSVFDTSRKLESFTQNSFTNGLLGKRTVIDIEGAYPNITVEQAKEIKDSFQREYSGAENAGRPILKKKGFEYSELGTSTDNKASELSENRKFQKEEVAEVFQLPTEWDDLERAFTLFNEFAVKPMATQFQEAINSLLDEERFYFEFDYNGLMKVSLTQRIDAEIKQINNGLLSIDEARALENRSPVEAGDCHFMPVNMMPWNEETKNAYMAKQKNEAQQTNPTDPDAQHFGGGDDKQ